MRKTGHRARREDLSAGRIEYIEAARQRLRNRRLRRTALLVALVAAAVIYLTGLVNTSVMALEELADTARIALMPEQGFPQQTGAGEVFRSRPAPARSTRPRRWAAALWCWAARAAPSFRREAAG